MLLVAFFFSFQITIFISYVKKITQIRIKLEKANTGIGKCTVYTQTRQGGKKDSFFAICALQISTSLITLLIKTNLLSSILGQITHIALHRLQNRREKERGKNKGGGWRK